MTGPDDEEIIAALASSPGDPPTTDLFSRVAEGARRRRHRHVFVAATSAAVVVTAVAVMPTLLHRTTAPVAAPPAGGISTPPTCAPTRSVAPSADARKVGRLLPGTPAEGVLCVYALRTESGDPSGQLSGQISLTGRTLSDVVAAAHALVPTTAVASCPAPDSADVLTFAFPDESTISLDISCAMVWQGSGPHAMLADPLASQLQVLEAKATEDAPSPAAGSSIAPAGSALVSGAATALPGQPVSPDSLAIASDGTLYVADGLLDVVFARSPSGGFSVVAGTGITGYSGDGGPATSAELNMPRGMVVEPDGTLLIADTGNNRVRAVSPAGVITTVAGNGRGGPQDVLARAPDAVLDQPADVNLDPHGNLLIVTSTEVVRMTSDGSLTVVAGGTPGGLVGIGGPASAGSADLPNGVAASNDGGIYISGEATKALLHVTASGTLGVVGSGDDFYPRGFGGLRNAADGSVIAMNGQQVLRYRGTTPSLVYDFGSQPYFGDVHAFIPNGLAVSSSGDIYVDTDGNSGWADRPAIVRIDTHNHATTIWEGPPAAGPWSPPPSVMPRHS